MNKKVIIFLALSVLLSPILTVAFTFPPTPLGGIFSIKKLFSDILDLVWVVFVAVAIIMFIVSGVLFLTAQGDPGKLQQARNAVIGGAVGVAIGIIAFSIVFIINNVI